MLATPESSKLQAPKSLDMEDSFGATNGCMTVLVFQPPKKIFYYIMVGVLVNKLGKVMVQLCSMGLGTTP